MKISSYSGLFGWLYLQRGVLVAIIFVYPLSMVSLIRFKEKRNGNVFSIEQEMDFNMDLSVVWRPQARLELCIKSHENKWGRCNPENVVFLLGVFGPKFADKFYLRGGLMWRPQARLELCIKSHENKWGRCNPENVVFSDPHTPTSSSHCNGSCLYLTLFARFGHQVLQGTLRLPHTYAFRRWWLLRVSFRFFTLHVWFVKIISFQYFEDYSITLQWHNSHIPDGRL